MWRSPWPLLAIAPSAQRAAAAGARARIRPGRHAAFEGWYQNTDGSFTLLVGYFNRNSKETLDIPVGPNNRIEPGGPDQGQPTHFMTASPVGRLHHQGAQGFRRQAIDVDDRRQRPDEFHPGRRDQGLPGRAVPRGGAEERAAAPAVRPEGPVFSGPPVGIAATFTGAVGTAGDDHRRSRPMARRTTPT